MDRNFRRSGSIRSLRSRLLGLGSAAALVVAGAALVGVLPAAATTALSFSTGPVTAATAGTAIATFDVSGATAGDIVTITTSSPCTLSSGAQNSGTETTGAIAFTGVTFLDAGTGTCTLTATDSVPANATAVTSPSITVSPGTAAKIGFSTAPPTSAAADTVLPTFKVSTEDAEGNVVTTAPTDTIVISSSCTLGGTTSAVEASGTATFSAVQINSVGNCPLIASDTTAPDTAYTVTSPSVVVSGGAPAKVAFNVAPPASVTTTGTVVPTFKTAVEDANGNIDTTGAGSTDSITVSSPCITTPVTATAVAGVATFASIEFATTGACVLTATDVTAHYPAIVAATATVQVGEAQPALSVTTKTGYLDAPLTLGTSGGAGTGAVTFTATNGTATGCVVTGGVLKATTGGTCIVTATKAAVTPYATATSVATTVTISSAPKALRVVGAISNARKSTVTVTGYNFSGRPKIVSNVAGFSATVSRDSGKSLTIVVTVKGSASKPGVKVMTIRFANGKSTSLKYSLR